MENFGASARDALRAHQYPIALDKVRAGLIECLARPQLKEGAPPPQYLLGSQFGHLAAAFDDDDALTLMEQLAERIADEALGLPWDAKAAAHEFRDAQQGMRDLRDAVQGRGPVPVRELEDVVRRTKSRLTWLEKIGVLHVVDGVVHAGAAVEEERSAPAPTVPEFKEYFTKPEMLATQEQRAFYETFKAAALSGAPVELEGNLSYGFALLNELRRGLGSDPATFERVLRLFADSYDGTSLGSFAVKWLADLRFLERDFDGGYAILNPGHLDFQVYVNLAPHVTDSRLTVSLVDRWLGESNKLSPFARGRIDEVRDAMQDLLDAAHDDLGCSIVTDLRQRLFVDRPPGQPAPPTADEFGGFLSDEDLRGYLHQADKAQEARGRGGDWHDRKAFEGMPDHRLRIRWPEPWRSEYWFAQIARERLKALYREAENLVRREGGIPSVGEGWVSEVALLNELRAAFPEERIVHQARPAWLRPQSLDIYLPDRSIAVEYQGLQHSEPVARFGGRPAFERQLERDERKRDLCARHRCTLIEVFPGYELANVVTTLRTAIADQAWSS